MIVQINDRFRIKSDGVRCFTVQEYKPPKQAKEDAEPWKDTGYYTTLESACDGIRNKAAAQLETESLDELMFELKSLRIDIIKAFSKHGGDVLGAIHESPAT